MSDSTGSEVTAVALAEFRDKKDDLVAKTISRLIESRTDYQHFGDKAEDIMTAGFGFLNQMLETTLEFDETAILEHQLEWSMNRLPHDGVPVSMLLNNIRVYRLVVEENLSPESAGVVGRVLGWMLDRLEELNRGLDTTD